MKAAKRAAALVAAAMLAITLAGCGWHGSGVVTGKDWRHAYTTTSMTLVGKVMVPIVQYWPADYWLHVRNSAGKNHDVDVDQVEYDRARVGDTFTNGN